MDTVGVLSVLEGEVQASVKAWWDHFATTYHSTGVQTFAYPNVTFQGGDTPDMAALRQATAQLAARLQPFTVTLDGFGTFEAARVIYLAVHLSDELRQIHAAVHDLLQRHCDRVFAHYQPDTWVPHVTLAMTDLTETAFAQATEALRDTHPRYTQTLHNLCLVRLDPATGMIDLVERWPLGPHGSRP